MPLPVKEWLKENYPHPHDGFVIPSPEMVEEYACYYHAELSRQPKDVVEAIHEKYPHLERQEGLTYHSMKMHNDHADLLRLAALHGYSLAAGESVKFAEWANTNRWHYDSNDNVWYYTFEHGTAMSAATYKKNYTKTSEQLHELFKKDTL